MNKKFINKICAKFGVEVNGISYMQSLRKKAVEPDVWQIQKDLVNGKAKVIFDLGANDGGITRQYASYFPGAQIYSFEPFPAMFSQLEQNTAALSQVHRYQKAVSGEIGKHVFYVNEGVDTNSLLAPQETGLRSDEQVKNKTSIEVDTITIDEVCRKEGIEFIDILKMDIQGGELDALKGCVNMLSQRKVGVIYTESYFIPQYVNQPLFSDIMNFLLKYDYQTQDIYNLYYGNGCLAWCDAIFLPRKPR